MPPPPNCAKIKKEDDVRTYAFWLFRISRGRKKYPRSHTNIYEKSKKISEIGDIMPECVNLWLKLKL